MREHISGQEDPLRNLISTTALLLLSSVITDTTAFSLKHEKLASTRADISTNSSEAVAIVTGISHPLLDKAISLFDSSDKWPANSILNSGKGLPGPFKPFMPLQALGGHVAAPLPSHLNSGKDQGIYIPQPPNIPEPLQVTILESQEPEMDLVEPEPPVEIPASEIPELEVIEPIPPGQTQSQDAVAIFPQYFLWQVPKPSYPSSGPSQHVSVAVTGNVGEFNTSNNVNMQVVASDAEGEHVKHNISPGSSIEKVQLREEQELKL